jgi:hypothetical protein
MSPTPTDLARTAYAAHRKELLRVGTEYDPGPWEELSLDIRDIWVAHVQHIEREREARKAKLS